MLFPYLTSSELSVQIPAQYQNNRDEKAIESRRNAIDIGRKHFHVRAINRSYRIRGIVPRTQTNINIIISAFIERNGSLRSILQEVPVKKIADSNLIIKILVYSAIKMRAKLPLLNSTLKPETNSDSPSAKSKGVRFVSARILTNQVMKIGGAKRKIHVYWEVLKR